MDIQTALSAAIDRAVKGGQTLYGIAKAAGLKPEVLYRFVAGERDLRLSSAAKLCTALRLKLRPANPARKSRGSRGR